ncbi:hypothetical protein V1477_010982 [Vespula maculifrons]|uniref:Uncharacterized protein n=1 Tax=Vespula maculifrons TaxID=7453 RepID=A0ABD2C5D0_VESMC
MTSTESMERLPIGQSYKCPQMFSMTMVANKQAGSCRPFNHGLVSTTNVGRCTSVMKRREERREEESRRFALHKPQHDDLVLTLTRYALG